MLALHNHYHDIQKTSLTDRNPLPEGHTRQNSGDLCLCADVALEASDLPSCHTLHGMPTPQTKYSNETMLLHTSRHLTHRVAHGVLGTQFGSGKDAGARHATETEHWSRMMARTMAQQR